MLRTVIVEDEEASRQLLLSIIDEYCPSIKVIGVAANVADGVDQIENLIPDLIFLDIHIGQQTGFDLLDRIDQKDFKVIITTAYEEYALKAFKYEAVDYILKPYTPKDVIRSIQRIQQKLEDSKAFQQLEKVIKNSLQNKEYENISFPTSDGLKVYKIRSITRIEGSGAYCRIFSLDTKPLLISKSMKEVEVLLPENLFFRIHDSHVINLKHIKEFRKEDGGVVILENDDQIPVSRRKKQEFLDVLMSN